LARFREAMAAGGLDRFVQAIEQRSFETRWDQPIALLLIDGLHDYANVARDFHHFEPWLTADGLVAFHDYWAYFPGVIAFVNELLTTGGWREVDRAGSLIVLRRVEPVALSVVALETPRAVPAGAA
jgi:hypothetical protein